MAAAREGYAGHAAARDAMRAALHRWRTWRAVAELAAARAFAAEQRLRLLYRGGAVSRGLLAGWRQWGGWYSVASARHAVGAAAGRVADNRRLAVALRQWQLSLPRLTPPSSAAATPVSSGRGSRSGSSSGGAGSAPCASALRSWRAASAARSKRRALGIVLRWRRDTRHRIGAWQAWRRRVEERRRGAAEQLARQELALGTLRRRHAQQRVRAWLAWLGHAQRQRQETVGDVAVRLTRLWKAWRHWETEAGTRRGLAAAAAVAAAYASVYASAQQHSRPRSALPATRVARTYQAVARWRRWTAYWCAEERWALWHCEVAWRLWRQDRDVRAAIHARRTVHRVRWALCRAWGRWRLHAVVQSLHLAAMAAGHQHSPEAAEAPPPAATTRPMALSTPRAAANAFVAHTQLLTSAPHLPSTAAPRPTAARSPPPPPASSGARRTRAHACAARNGIGIIGKAGWLSEESSPSPQQLIKSITASPVNAAQGSVHPIKSITTSPATSQGSRFHARTAGTKSKTGGTAAFAPPTPRRLSPAA